MKRQEKERWNFCKKCRIIFDRDDNRCPKCSVSKKDNPGVESRRMTPERILELARRGKVWTKHHARFLLDKRAAS
jgi:hypothetical protein